MVMMEQVRMVMGDGGIMNLGGRQPRMHWRQGPLFPAHCPSELGMFQSQQLPHIHFTDSMHGQMDRNGDAYGSFAKSTMWPKMSKNFREACRAVNSSVLVCLKQGHCRHPSLSSHPLTAGWLIHAWSMLQ